MAEDELRTGLARDGFIVLRKAVPDSVLDELGSVLESLEGRGQPRSRQVLYTHRPPPESRPALDALMDQWLNPHRLAAPNTLECADAIRSLVASLLGQRALLFQDLLLCKRPGQQPFPWHQDYPFWPVDSPRGLVVWVPLADTDAGCGGLAFARASHRLGPQPVIDLHTGMTQDEDAELGFEPRNFELVAPRYERGDAVAFFPTTFHGSPAMRNAGLRRAWSSAWLVSGARWCHANAPRHPLCTQVRDGVLIEESRGAE